MRLSANLEENVQLFREELGIGASFDVVSRRIRVGGREAVVLFVDGFVKDEVAVEIMKSLASTPRRDISLDAVGHVLARRIPYVEIDTVETSEEVIDNVLAGPMALILDGEKTAVIIDTRQYPARNPAEPDIERVTRGSRDGFVETLVFNTALIRRRIRDPGLRAELLQVGRRSKTDVALIYVKELADPGLVDLVRERIRAIRVDAVPMAEKTIEEFLARKETWWNPFPVVRYTERPDVAAVHLAEGHVVVLVDTSPSALIVPATLFHHLQHAEEFRQDPAVGAYLRWVRLAGILVSLLLPPLWLGAALRPGALPSFLRFIGPRQPGRVPLFAQFVLAELGIDLVRMALIHTPSAIATSLGFIGAIFLGEFAVRVGLFSPEAVLYVAIAAIGTFATPSIELGLAVRIVRLGLLVAAAVAGVPGVGLGFLVVFAGLARTSSFGVGYLWPLLPLNARALREVIFRRPVPLMASRPAFAARRDLTRVGDGEAGR